MGESNVDQTTKQSDEERLPAFILEKCLTDNIQEEQIEYKLNAPLCISKIYKNEFFPYFHLNYSGTFENQELFFASIRVIAKESNEEEEEEEERIVQALIRTKTNNYHVSNKMNITNEENLLRMLFNKVQLQPIQHYEIIRHINANGKLLEFDQSNDEQYSSKIALIFQRLNQTSEDEIFNNNDLSMEMEDFLSFISDRIELKNFPKYRGDLDVKTNEHGIYSYFTTFQNHQIMFNVAQMIPLDKNNRNFIQRKGLIGNALICVVFQEGGATFQPDFILSKVTQVYITVQPIKIDSQLYYKIEIWRRNSIEPIRVPSVGIIEVNESFRSYFLTLLLNTMNIILKNEYFAKRIIEPRQQLRSDSMDKLSQLFSSYSKPIPVNLTQQVAQHQHSGLIPKILEAFSTPRHDTTKKQIGKPNSWVTNYGKVKRYLSTSSNNSATTDLVENRAQLLNPNFERSISSESISSLVTTLPHHIGSNTEKSFGSHPNLNIEGQSVQI
ncbi:unnamed protein product [Adineta ricciae]|uniref:Rap-GAP domain-containing protein n=1 Tax=Adineta ricciae TaxID=249248 RepID=A0A815WFM0_ADIRI|nr:unnamed protein product [Adineta ricciae]